MNASGMKSKSRFSIHKAFLNEDLSTSQKQAAIVGNVEKKGQR